MTVFYGKLKMQGDDQVLPAVVKVDLGKLSVASGQHPIGEWKINEVKLADVDGATIDLTVDGETLLLHLTEHDRFLRETEPYRPDDANRFRKRQRRREESKRPEEPKVPVSAATEPAPAKSRLALADRFKREVAEEAAPVLHEAKTLLARVQDPKILWGAVALIIAGVLLVPTVIYALFMLTGIVAVLVGGVTYVDNTFAVRLPNQVTPIRLLIAGSGLLVLAFLIALI